MHGNNLIKVFLCNLVLLPNFKRKVRKLIYIGIYILIHNSHLHLVDLDLYRNGDVSFPVSHLSTLPIFSLNKLLNPHPPLNYFVNFVSVNRVNCWLNLY